MLNRETPQAKIVFVTGTGTDVGKTWVAARLLTSLKGVRAGYFKPVQTGHDRDEETVRAQVQGSGATLIPTKWQFKLPAAPSQAAAAEGTEGPRADAVADEIFAATKNLDVLLVEGAGGWRVPLNSQGEEWSHVLKHLSASVVLVGSSSLGTLNHTSLAVDGLVHSGEALSSVVLSGPRHRANEESLRQMLPGLKDRIFATAEEGWEDRVWGAALRTHDTSWIEMDRQHVWHPYTQHGLGSEPLPVVSAQGVWLTLADGRRVLDGISSWWVNNLGHGRPEFANALREQQPLLDHVIFAGATHEPAARLAESLVEATGKRFGKVFYSDNGSTAVEVALKMAWQFFANRGAPRRRFAAIKGGYHGDTFGAMSVGRSSGFYEPFEPMLFGVDWLDPDSDPHSTFLERAHDWAGVILEPGVQGSAGMKFLSTGWLQTVDRLCREAGVPLIADEVFTGFGRTGAMFGFERCGIGPKIVCLGKGLTGGTMTLGATLATDDIFAAFLGKEKSKALLHGHSFTGNPIACKVALTAVGLAKEEHLPKRALRLERTFQAWIERNCHRGMENPRALGGILAFEIPGRGDGYFAGGADGFVGYALSKGVWLRPLGRTVYFMPPLTIQEAELNFALQIMEDALT